MLRTNLSTRPFYNERVVHLLLGVVALALLAFTAFNVTRLTSLSRAHAELGGRIDAAEERARGLRAEAVRVRRSIDQKQLETISAAAKEANELIDRRIFSWTELFNLFETTLPENVRITAVRPKIDREGQVTLTVVVAARRVEDVDDFMEQLEGTGVFAGLLSREEHVTDDGLLQATLESRYVPAAAPPPAGTGTE